MAVVGGFPSSEGDELEAEFANWCSSLGELLPQDAQGSMVREVRNRGMALGEGRSGRYSDTNEGGHLHSDGAHWPLPVPDYLALLCVRPATHGGELLVAELSDFLRKLDGKTVDRLREDFYVDRRGDEAPGEASAVRKPILFLDDAGGLCISYIRKYIELAHAREEVPPLTDSKIRAMDALDRAISTSPVHARRLEAGQIAVLDNRRVLHGRTAFVDRPGQGRLLYRAWIRV